jgi:DNA-binding response OmpR family regulator
MVKYVSAQSKVAGVSRLTVRPCICVVDGKQHIRTFLRDALEEFDVTTCECANIDELGAALDLQQLPDLVLLGPSLGGIKGSEMLRALAANGYGGKVLLLGPGVPILEALQACGERLGLAMLPAVPTPFGTDHLRNSIAALRLVTVPQSPIDLAGARLARTLLSAGV